MAAYGKILVLTLNEQEEKVTNKIISAISDYIQIEPMHVSSVSILSFPGLEIILHQRRVLRDGKDISLTRLGIQYPCTPCLQYRHCPHTDANF